jgi:hypothetical protein
MIAGPESSGHPGTVKVLDFGLAKLAPDLGAAGEAAGNHAEDRRRARVARSASGR